MFLYLESLAALDEIVGDAGEAVVGEVEHAQELQVLELAAEKDEGGQILGEVASQNTKKKIQLTPYTKTKTEPG